ncbi:N-acetylmuramoyl-L-alanine amidase [Hymenobacter ruricola]|uniref:N-acetylmuramoyl-L-alanine amidase n=1 Tax=Hymenobacter ruricola TaxID=2791023 RepID=A0ABS0I242_9BACT|nr:N-acetylmuramoyl-L-alanine amidase [Hymenobacter ruricola]MBF9221010.1 N-acetylmuramoyl-L-alanine amidase [Hymenobacter ruricola]
MIIDNHWLKADSTSEKITKSPSQNVRNVIDPDYLIIHYTAGDKASEAINWFKDTTNNPDKIAAHIVIDQNGAITQLIPFNCRANHAGSSTWDGVENFNYHSIGIELVNPGFCEKLADGSFRRRVSDDKFKTYPAERAADIVAKTHKLKFWNAADNKYWFKFPAPQLAALYALSKVLVAHYKLIAVLGHDDIAPLRKPDPGPAFPWKEFKTAVLGRADNVGNMFAVNTNDTKFRADHSRTSAEIASLPAGYIVGLIETVGAWNKVYLANEKSKLMKDGRCVKTIGWIHSSLLDLK